MNITCFNPDLAHFHQDRKSKCQGKRNKGRPETESLERPYCTEEDTSTDKHYGVNYSKIHPIFYSLMKVEWAIFGNLTWKKPSYRKDNPRAEQDRFNCFYSLVRRTCQSLQLKQKEIQYFVTNERGNASECHLQFLIGKNGLRDMPFDRVCLTMQFLWDNHLQLTKNGIQSNRTLWGAGGRRQIEPFEPKQKIALVAYVCKRERDNFGNEYPASYKLSIALVKHIQEINAGVDKPPPKPPPSICKRSKSIKKYFCPVSVRPKSPTNRKERPQSIKKHRDMFRARDPPSCVWQRKGCYFVKKLD